MDVAILRKVPLSLLVDVGEVDGDVTVSVVSVLLVVEAQHVQQLVHDDPLLLAPRAQGRLLPAPQQQIGFNIVII